MMLRFLRRNKLPWSVKTPPADIPAAFPSSQRWPDTTAIDAFINSLSLKEKINLLSGPSPGIGLLLRMLLDYNREPFIAGEVPGADLPGIRFTDGPRGVVMYSSTCFPAAIARGATWDPELEARVADVIGVESRAQGANLFAGVCINLLRHPGWGRAQETYGEDPVHVGEMGVAAVRGSQRHVMACVKHYACNSIENSRFRVSVEIDPRALHELYLPHFYRCVIEAGAASVMSAYNRVNGTYCGHHRELLTDILRQRWGFEGFVMSDFLLGVRDGPAGLAAGLDLEMPFRWRFGHHLARAIKQNRLDASAVDQALKRMLSQQVRFADSGEPERYRPADIAGPAHRQLARETAIAATVLLKNEPASDKAAEPLLPLETDSIDRLAVVGPLADRMVIGDEGSSMVRPPQVTSVLEGLRQGAPDDLQICHTGAKTRGAARLAASCDAAVVVVGYTHADEGENLIIKGGDRKRLTLRRRDEALIRAVQAANPRTVVVMIGGSAIVTERWRHQVPAILMAWYPGMEGGHALADILFGHASPGGKLPCVFPRDVLDLPDFDFKSRRVKYNLFHGYRYLDINGTAAAFPFGWGLSYTTFNIGHPHVETPAVAADNGHLLVEVDIENTGTIAGSEVVQLYIGGPEASGWPRPLRQLKAFQKVQLAPGESTTLRLEVTARALAVFDPNRGEHGDWYVEPGRYTAWVGTSASLADLTRCHFTVKKSS